jgi:hypothetical protein
LFEELAERLKINLSGVVAAVASDEELAAARAAGAHPVHIAPGGNGAGEAFASLMQFSDALLTGHLAPR